MKPNNMLARCMSCLIVVVSRLRFSGISTPKLIFLIFRQVALLQCSSAFAGAVKVWIIYTNFECHSSNS